MGIDLGSNANRRTRRVDDIEEEEEVKAEPEKEFWNVNDILLSPFRGAEEAGRELYGLVDTLSQDVLPDFTEKRFFGEADTTLGAIATGLSQFAVGYVATGGALGVLSGAAKAAKFYNVAKGLNLVSKAGSLKGASIATRVGLEATKGAITDFAFFSGQDGRLSDLLNETEYGNVVTEFLGSDKGDSEIEGRLKNVLEGAGLGIALDSILLSLFRHRSMKNALNNGKNELQAYEIAIEENPDKFVGPPTAESLQLDLQIDPPTGATPAATKASAAQKKAYTKATEALRKTTELSTEGRNVDLMLRDNVHKPKVERGEALEFLEGVEADFLRFKDLGGKLIRNPRKKVKGSFLHSDEALGEQGIERFGSTNFSNVGLNSPDDVDAMYRAVENSYDKVVEVPAKGTADEELEALHKVMEDSYGYSDSQAKVVINNIDHRHYIDGITDVEERVQAIGKSVAAFRTIAFGYRDELLEQSKFLGPLNQLDTVTLVAYYRNTQTVGAIIRGNNRVGTAQSRNFSARKLQPTKDDIYALKNKSGRHSDESVIEADEFLLKATGAKGKEAQAEARARIIQYIEVTEQAIRATQDPKVGMAGFMKHFKAQGKQGKVDLVVDYWINSILSGPKTHIVNIMGNVGMAFFRPVKTIAGGFLTGETKVIQEGIDEMGYLAHSFYEISRLSELFGPVTKARAESKTAVARAFNDGYGVLFDEQPYQLSESATAFANGENLSQAHRSVNGGMGEWVKSNVGHLKQARKWPTKALAASDAWFKQANTRASLKTTFKQEGRALGLAGKDLASHIVNRMDEAIVDGTVISKTKLYGEATNEAYNEIRAFGSNPFDTDGAGLPRIEALTDDIYARKLEENAATLGAIKTAKGRATEAVFQTDIGEYGGFIDGAVSGIQRAKQAVPLLRFIIPFDKTPTNIVKEVIDHSPLGGMDALGRWVYAHMLGDASDFSKSSNKTLRQLNSGDPVEKAQAVGRLAFAYGGSMFLYNLAWSSFDDDANFGITGTGPENIEERLNWKAAGNQEDSIWMRDENGKKVFYSYQRLQPLAGVFKFMADLVTISHYHEDDNDIDRVKASVVKAILGSMTEQSFMEPLKNFTKMAASGNPKDIETWINRLAGGFVPSAINELANNNVEAEFKEVRGFVDSWKSRIPWFNQEVAPRRNILGEPVKRYAAWEDGTFNAFLSRWSPYPVNSEEFADPVNVELAEVSYAGKGISYTYTVPGAKLNVDLRDPVLRHPNGMLAIDFVRDLSSKIEIGGLTLRQRLLAVVSADSYQALPNPDNKDIQNPRRNTIGSVISMYRAAAKRQMLIEIPAILESAQDARREEEFGEGFLR